MTDVALVALAVLAGSLVKGVTGLGLPPVALAWANRNGLYDADHPPLMVVAGIVGAFVGSRRLAGRDEVLEGLDLRPW